MDGGVAAFCIFVGDVGVRDAGGFEGEPDVFASAWDTWVVEEFVGGVGAGFFGRGLGHCCRGVDIAVVRELEGLERFLIESVSSWWWKRVDLFAVMYGSRLCGDIIRPETGCTLKWFGEDYHAGASHTNTNARI